MQITKRTHKKPLSLQKDWNLCEQIKLGQWNIIITRFQVFVFFFLSLKESIREVTFWGRASLVEGVAPSDFPRSSCSLLSLRSLPPHWSLPESSSRPPFLLDRFFLCFLSRNRFWWARIGNSSTKEKKWQYQSTCACLLTFLPLIFIGRKSYIRSNDKKN